MISRLDAWDIMNGLKRYRYQLGDRLLCIRTGIGIIDDQSGSNKAFVDQLVFEDGRVEDRITDGLQSYRMSQLAVFVDPDSDGSLNGVRSYLLDTLFGNDDQGFDTQAIIVRSAA